MSFGRQARYGRVLDGLVLAAAIALSGCGNDVTGPPPPSPTPPPVVTETIVIFGDSGSVPAESGGYIEFPIPGAGTVAATVDWTFASSQVGVALTTSACDDLEAAFLGSCSHIAPPNITRNMKPKTVTGTVAAPLAARLWLVNLAPVDESMAVQVTLTRTRSASASLPALESFARSWVPVAQPVPRLVQMSDE